MFFPISIVPHASAWSCKFFLTLFFLPCIHERHVGAPCYGPAPCFLVRTHDIGNSLEALNVYLQHHVASSSSDLAVAANFKRESMVPFPVILLQGLYCRKAAFCSL